MAITSCVCYRCAGTQPQKTALHRTDFRHDHMTPATPYALSPAFEQILARQCGWVEPFSGPVLARLAAGVKKIADIYTGGREPCAAFADPALRASYAAYYLPCNAVKLFPVLRELERCRSVLGRGPRLRVLDLGCGPGTLIAGLLDFCMQHGKKAALELDITAIDRDGGNCSSARELIQAYCAAAPEAPAVTAVHILTGDVHRLAMSAESGFDLIMAGNLVNELSADRHAAISRRIRALLKPDGIVIILDPGTHQSFKNLLQFRQELLGAQEIHLLAPCLQPGSCPLQHCPDAWCHEKLCWSPPGLVRLIDERTGFTKHKGVKFSYLVATRGASPARPCEGDKLWRVVSYVIRNKGEERLYVCNGRERRLLRRLARITSAASADFSVSERGDSVTVTGAEPRNGFFDIGPDAVFRKSSCQALPGTLAAHLNQPC